MGTCEICDKEVIKLSQCRNCRAEVCSNCLLGNKCVDCVKDESGDGDRPTKFNHKDF